MLNEDIKLVAPSYTVTIQLVAQVKHIIPTVTPTTEEKVKKYLLEDPFLHKCEGNFSKHQPDKKQERINFASVVLNGAKTPCITTTQEITIHSMQIVHSNSVPQRNTVRAIMLRRRYEDVLCTHAEGP